MVLVLAVALSAVPARAWDTGWEAGFVGSVSVTGKNSIDDELRYIGLGAGTAYRWQVPVNIPVKLYVRPALSMQCMLLDNSQVYGDAKLDRAAFEADFGLGLGINIYKNLSFYTGPQFRYTAAGKKALNYRSLNNHIASYWSFGLYLKVSKAYIMMKYCQNLNTHEFWDGGLIKWNYGYRNKFEIGIGHRF